MTFSVDEAARRELLEAADWYDSRQSGLGEEFLVAVEFAFQECLEHPLQCSRMELYRGLRDVRRVTVRCFPYSIIFRLLGTELRVTAIAHSSRRPLYWVDRL